MLILTTNTALHAPPFEVFNGQQEPHQEVPARAETIKKALVQEGFSLTEVNELVPLSLLKKVHQPEYVTFLKNFCSTMTGLYQYPSIFSLHSYPLRGTHPLAQLGHFSFDMYTPVLPATFASAHRSASLAWKGAVHLLQGGSVCYALCRPPGHHAEYNQMGGYCYFNNAAVAAQTLSEQGRVAILDVDFHHGNGTQHIFKDRGDVLTISIHADTSLKFPYLAGEKKVSGCLNNVNFPLPLGITNQKYQSVLEQAVKVIRHFRPDFLVIPLGLDTHQDDPIGGFKLTTKYYQKMAHTIQQLNLPTLIVQEGGYNTSQLGKNVVSFLRGFT